MSVASKKTRQVPLFRTNEFQTNRPKLVISTEMRAKIGLVGSSDGQTLGGTVSSTHRPKTNPARYLTQHSEPECVHVHPQRGGVKICQVYFFLSLSSVCGTCVSVFNGESICACM